MNTLISSKLEIDKLIQKYKDNFLVEKIDFSDSQDWHFFEGAFIHKSKGFFNVVGIEDELSNQKLMLYQPQHAITGLITSVIDNQRCYLIQARAEPGNINGVQFGPTIQSTPANYLKLHGGQSTRFIDFFVNSQLNLEILSETTQLDFGERYLYKCKRSIILNVTENIKPTDNYVWISHRLMLDLILEENLFNLDLRSLLSLLPWDEEFSLVSSTISNDESQIRPIVVGKVLSLLNHKQSHHRLIGISKLSNWEITTDSIREKKPLQNFTIEMFRVITKGREVNCWIQPLVNSCSWGKSVLVFRRIDNSFEVLVSIHHETGLASSNALFPTALYYPGQKEIETIELIKSVVDSKFYIANSMTLNSDEGGRFYQDISYYEMVEVEEEAKQKHDHLIWINLAELKSFLMMSNVVSIQLRALISQLYKV